MKILGLMSGTSLDGIDVALVNVDGASTDDFSWEVLGHQSVPYRADQRARIQSIIRGGNAQSLCNLNVQLGEWFSQASLDFLSDRKIEPSEVSLIGSHGQTVWHVPPDPDQDRRGSTLQLGCAATIAERTGVDVVSDFRSRDMAAGGHGAPLVAWTDQLMFTRPEGPRCLQNIGGMANVTWLPARGTEGSSDRPFAFDTGPGCALIDEAVRLVTDGGQTFDRDGRIAGRGTVNEELLQELMSEPYLSESPPKSTGRERFGADYVKAVADGLGLAPGSTQGWPGLVMTLVEFTAASIADAYEKWIVPKGIGEVVVTGGGARNPVLMKRLEARLAPALLTPAEAVLGFDPDAKEAVAFAVLAWANRCAVPSNLIEATGAARSVVLGSLTPGASGAGAARV
ncbi:MAG: anhydro-N-acetylmuramic acid kinase [Longimicrobiales bacterium]